MKRPLGIKINDCKPYTTNIGDNKYDTSLTFFLLRSFLTIMIKFNIVRSRLKRTEKIFRN